MKVHTFTDTWLSMPHLWHQTRKKEVKMWVYSRNKKINTQKHKKNPRADNLCLLTGTKCENESVWGTLSANIKKRLWPLMWWRRASHHQSAPAPMLCATLNLQLFCLPLPYVHLFHLGFKPVQAPSRPAHNLKITLLFSHWCQLISISAAFSSLSSRTFQDFDSGKKLIKKQNKNLLISWS